MDKLYLIVGIDPGTTTGIAILNFNGELLELLSSKNIGLRGVIEKIIEKGKASLIATDVNPCPTFVSNLATKLGAKLFVPKESLHVHEKNLLTKSYKVMDNHQRDALAAAITAFNFARKKFLDTNMQLSDEMKHLLLQGENVKKLDKPAKGEILSMKKEINAKVKEQDKKHKEGYVYEKSKEKELREEISFLKEKISEKEDELKKLRFLLKKAKMDYTLELKKDEEITKRDNTIKNLKLLLDNANSKLNEFEKMKEVWRKIANKEAFALTIFPEISKFVIINGKVKNFDFEKIKDVEIFFTDNTEAKKHLENNGFSVRSTDNVREICGFFYIEKEFLEKSKEQDFSLQDIVESYRKERLNEER